jgi:hypothetical protein
MSHSKAVGAEEMIHSEVGATDELILTIQASVETNGTAVVSASLAISSGYLPSQALLLESVENHTWNHRGQGPRCSLDWPTLGIVHQRELAPLHLKHCRTP